MHETELKSVDEALDRFINRASDELFRRWEKWRVNLSEAEVYEVVGALLARQVTLATELARCPHTWNGHVAPLMLRAMADVFISIAWILGDPLERARKFIRYGLGRLKLELEHRKAEADGPYPESENFVQLQEDWINEQRFSFLVDVDLSAVWSGMSTRQMAEEAGHLDFYNYVYMPFSGCTHSMWQHIGRYNLKTCVNPLHRYHRAPACPVFEADIDYLYLAAKYLQKTFVTFDDATGFKLEGKSAFELLVDEISEIGDQTNRTQSTKDQ
ncbi:MAG: DUF5677 domain-containing protein [Geminicoccaceae bacterium]